MTSPEPGLCYLLHISISYARWLCPTLLKSAHLLSHRGTLGRRCADELKQRVEVRFQLWVVKGVTHLCGDQLA